MDEQMVKSGPYYVQVRGYAIYSGSYFEYEDKLPFLFSYELFFTKEELLFRRWFFSINYECVIK